MTVEQVKPLHIEGPWDPLPDGYHVTKNDREYILSGPDQYYVWSFSQRFKPETVGPKIRHHAKGHAEKRTRLLRRTAEEAFCEGFTNEQLEAVSIKTLVNVLENFMKIKEKAEIPVVLEMAKDVLAKLKGAKAKS